MKKLPIIALIDTKKNNTNLYIIKSILKTLKQHPGVGHVDLLTYDDLNARLAEKSYDLLLALDGEQLNVPIFQQAVKLVQKSALWVWEDPYERHVNLANAQLFDLVLTNDLGSVQAYGRKAHFLPLAAGDEISVREYDKDFDYDLFFAGSAWPNRITFLRRLLREMPELRTKIVLQYNQGVPATFLDLPESDYFGSISHGEFLKLSNASRVTLTLHRKFSGDGAKRAATSPGPRLFEIALAGGCQLVDATGVEVDQFFEPGREVELFSDFEGCKASLRKLLQQPAKRLDIARNAQTRARAEHTFGARIKALLRLISDLPTFPSAIAKLASPRTKQRLLFVTHNTIAGGGFGGVEVYQNTIASELRRDYEIMFFHPAHPPIRDGLREYVLTDQRYKIQKTFLVPDFDMFVQLSHRPLEEAFGRILSDFGIDIVHFQHLINHCASLPIIARMVGVPSIFTFHDFWTVCKKYNLIDHTGNYCNIDHRVKTACDVCLNRTDGLHPGAQSYRREFFNIVLRSINTIIFNTPHTVKVVKSIYPDLPITNNPVLGIPTPLHVAKKRIIDERLSDENLKKNAPLTVVFLGNFTAAKGADVFLNAAAVMHDDNIIFTVCGRIDELYLNRIEDRKYRNIVTEGSFAPGEVDLTRFDIALHLSIWPETYCITLSEAWQAGLVPIVSDCGALSDRVSHGVNGYKIEIGDSGELVSLLRRLINRQELEATRANIGPHLWLTPSQHVDSLKKIYQHVRQGRTPNSDGALETVVGSGPTLDLTELAPLPHQWTARTSGPSIPQYGRDIAPLSPLWKQSGEIYSALARGYVSQAKMKFYIDEFEGHTIDLAYWATTPLTSQRLSQMPRVKGWVALPDGKATEMQFGLRSYSGDLVLIPADVTFRVDVLHATGQQAYGFQTAPITLDVLDTGLYGLEIYRQIRSDYVRLTSLPYVILVGHETVCLALNPKDPYYPTVPLPAIEWPSPPPFVAKNLKCTIDQLTIANYSPPNSKPLFVLEIRGWIAAKGTGGTKEPILCMSGPVNSYLILSDVERLDVVNAHGPDVGKHCGFGGLACLTDLPAGEYNLSLLYHANEEISSIPVGAMIIENGEAMMRSTVSNSRTEISLARRFANATRLVKADR